MSSLEQMEGETHYQVGFSCRKYVVFYSLNKAMQQQCCLFCSELTWRSLRMIMMSPVHSCRWIADLTLFLMYEKIHLCISLGRAATLNFKEYLLSWHSRIGISELAVCFLYVYWGITATQAEWTLWSRCTIHIYVTNSYIYKGKPCAPWATQ